MPVIPAFRRLSQEDYREIKASLGYRVRPYFRSHKPKLKIKPQIPRSSKQIKKSDQVWMSHRGSE